MNEASTEHPSLLHFVLVPVVAWVSLSVGLIVEQTVWWTDHLEGFMNGVAHSMLYGMLGFFALLPWGLVILFLHWRRRFRGCRVQWLIIPAALLGLVPILGLAIDPPTARGTFERFVVSPMPDSVSQLQIHRAGGGLADYTFLLYFELAPRDFEAILASQPFERSDRHGRPLPLFRAWAGEEAASADIDVSPPTNSAWPDPRKWEDLEVYEYFQRDSGWWYSLVTDHEHRRVYVQAASM